MHANGEEPKSLYNHLICDQIKVEVDARILDAPVKRVYERTRKPPFLIQYVSVHIYTPLVLLARFPFLLKPPVCCWNIVDPVLLHTSRFLLFWPLWLMFASNFMCVEYTLLRLKTLMLLDYVRLNYSVAETKLHHWRLDIGQSWFVNPSI